VFTVAAATDDGSPGPRIATTLARVPSYVAQAFAGRPSAGTADSGLTMGRVLYATALDVRTGGVLLRELDGDELSERLIAPLALDLVVVFGLLAFAVSYLRSRGRVVALERAQELASMRADFVAAVSHELRTPLAQIKLFATLLRDGALRDADEERRATRVIEREAERLTILVDNVLAHARFSRRRVPGVKASGAASANVARDVASVVESFAPLAAERRVTLVSHVPDTMQAAIDSHALRQILLNLVENAVKYGPDAQTVTLGGEATDAHVRLTVSDEGPGLAAEELERVWLPFERGGAAAATSAGGSGIGLSVVRDLVSEYGGRVRVERLPIGVRFVVELRRG
jgi:signal transduction histidine kinase